MPEEKLRLICPNLKCRTILNVPKTARGRIIRCGQCGFRVKVPAPPEAAPSSSSPSSQTGG